MNSPNPTPPRPREVVVKLAPEVHRCALPYPHPRHPDFSVLIEGPVPECTGAPLPGRQVWTAAQQPLSGGDNPSEVEELATELAEERTLHQETIRERDELRQEVKRLAWLERMGHRHALQADQDAAQADARLAQRDAEIARLRAKEAVWNLAQFDAEDLRRTLAALNVALYWAHPDTPQGRDEIAGCRVALEMGQAALERLREPSVRPDTDRTPDVGTPDHRALIRDLTDRTPCAFDHHGNCQAHGWLTIEPRCPHARAKDLLAGWLP